MNTSTPMINRRYKDGIFRLLFGTSENKQNLLSLYNALTGSDYTDESQLTINTLEDVIYMNMKNDVSCIIEQSLSLFEHQSTFNPNMPLRGFLYFSKLYQKYLADIRADLYHPSLVKIPAPKYYVLYNGSVEKEDRMLLKLSDSFQKPVEEGTFEWTAVMLNINFGHNKQLMAACRILEEYSIFVDFVRKCQIEYPSIEEAISQAIDICIRRGVLSDFLIRHRGEVMDVCLTTYDEEQHLKNVYEYARSEGVEEGRAEGLAKGRIEGLAEERIRLVGHVIQSLQLRQFSEAQIISELQQLFPFTEEEACNLFKQYELSK